MARKGLKLLPDIPIEITQILHVHICAQVKRALRLFSTFQLLLQWIKAYVCLFVYVVCVCVQKDIGMALIYHCPNWGVHCSLPEVNTQLSSHHLIFNVFQIQPPYQCQRVFYCQCKSDLVSTLMKTFKHLPIYRVNLKLLLTVQSSLWSNSTPCLCHFMSYIFPTLGLPFTRHTISQAMLCIEHLHLLLLRLGWLGTTFRRLFPAPLSWLYWSNQVHFIHGVCFYHCM